jgi:hypothetical protein
MDVRETGWEDVDWVSLNLERDNGGGGDSVKTVMNFRVPQISWLAERLFLRNGSAPYS